jgi:hypothetical protein
MNYDCATHPIVPFITITQRFFQNVALKGTSHIDEWLSLFQFYRKTFLRLDPKQPKNVKFSLSSIIETSPTGGT